MNKRAIIIDRFIRTFNTARQFDREAVEMMRTFINTLRGVTNLQLEPSAFAPGDRGDARTFESNFTITRDGRIRCVLRTSIVIDQVRPAVELRPQITLTLRKLNDGKWLASITDDVEYDSSDRNQVAELGDKIVEDFACQAEHRAWSPAD